MTNIEIAQIISNRIGTEPIPFDSVYSLCLQIYQELGGTENEFDDVYSILLHTLPLTNIINDNVTATNKTWSSSKINSEIGAIAGTANSEIEGKTTEDFTFVQTLPVSGEEGQQVIIRGENADTLYKYVSGAWVIQTPDATKLYFDTENEALYSYVTADNQFAPVSLVNTIVVGSNLNTNAALKAIKTVGVYSVVQRLHSSTKGDYIKNWTLTVEGIDYDEYERTDSIYQRIQSNYTIQKRTWSSTRATNDGWSSFSTYYAGEIKDSTTSKYYTWSSNKLTTELDAKQDTLTAGSNITISGNTISATDTTYSAGSGITISGTSVSVDSSLLSEISGKQDVLTAGTNIDITNDTISAKGYTYDASKQSVAEGTSKALGNYSHSEGTYIEKTLPVTFSGAANATVLQASGRLSSIARNVLCLGCIVTIDGSAYTRVIDIDTTNNTITLYSKLSSEALSGATLKSVWGVAYGTNAHAEGNRTSAFGNNSHTEGEFTVAALPYCHAEGVRTIAFGRISHAEGSDNTASGQYSHVEGCWNNTSNDFEHASGVANLSHKASANQQDSGNTLFSIGNGLVSADARLMISQANAVEVMQNGDMYLYGVGNYDGIHIKGEVSGSTVQTLQEVINNKADIYQTATTADIEALFA